MDNRRKKPVITGSAPSSSGTATGQQAVVKQHISALYSPVNPFEADRRKEKQSSSTPVSSEKRKHPPSKTASASSLTTPTACKRLSSDFHRKCCADENDHDDRSCKALSDGRQRAAESPSPSGDRPIGRRSQSVPRTALRPITTTLSTIKRMEFNLERARDAAINSPMPVKTPYSSPYAMSMRRTPVTGSVSPSVFSTIKTPVHSARIAKGIMSGSKPKTPPVPTTRALALPKSATSSALVEQGKSGAADDRKTTAAVSYSCTRVSSKTPVTSKDVAASRSHRDADHVTVTQSGGKGNVNIRMKIDVDFKKSALPGVAVNDEADAQQSIRSISPRTRAKALLNYTPAAVKEYTVEQTAVSVAVRLRPFSTKELKNPDINRVVFLDKKRKCVSVNKNEFEFNHVLDSFDFDPIDDQEQVYDVVGKPLLDHCLEGYNACLFAYGQTGSGKTYSLTGDEDIMYYERQGVIPRLIKDLFLEMHLDSIVSMTYIEIYNDQIFNLLGDTTSDLQQLTYKIRESTIYGPYIPNLAPVVVESADDLLSRWSMGNIKRQKAATSCNEHSSRSHAILQITVQQKYHDDSLESENRESDADSQVSDGDRLVSKINLVDLAGSERVAQAQTTGDRFKEGTAINKSLLTLGKVISELSSMNEHRNKVHIPYRESTLTFLLKESLGGNSRTCMLATISPANTQIEETLSTLRYASKAQRIVNRVRINEDPKILRIRHLENEVHRLVQLLEQKGLTAKSLPPSPSTTASSAVASSPSTTEPDSSAAADSSNASAAAASAPSDYETPMKTPKKGSSDKEAKSHDKVEKEKASKAGKDKKAEKEAKSENVKKKGEKTVTAAEQNQQTGEKKQSKKQESKGEDKSHGSTPSNSESGRKAQKTKQTSPEEPNDGAVSSAKKDKKNVGSSEKPAKKTKESGVNTDSSPTEPKKKKFEKLNIPPPVASKLLDQISEIFSSPGQPQRDDRGSDHGQNTTDMTSLTYVSAGDASSLLNHAVIESSSSAMSDSTVQEVSRHVNFRDTVSMRSYEVSKDSTAAEASTASSSPGKKKSAKQSPKQKVSTPEPVPEEAQSDWGTGASSGWGAAEPETQGWGGGGSDSACGWGSNAKDTDKQQEQDEEESKEDDAAPSDGWGADENTESLTYSKLEGDENPAMSWSTCLKDNGVSGDVAQPEEKKDDDGGWGCGGGGW